MDNIKEYCADIQKQFNSGHAKEHAYRPALQRLMSSFDDVVAVNDPKRSAHGNPDFIFLKASNQKIIKGYAEAKDVDISLDKTEKTNQMERYSGYANLFLTNYLEFRFYKNGEKYKTLEIAKLKNGNLELLPTNYSQLADELAQFLALPPEQIKSGKRLAQIMGAKARRIRSNVTLYLDTSGDEKNIELEKMYKMMRELLVHDLTPEKFADMYAQTLVYGLFVARYNDTTPEDFTRQEARDLIPASNPFLRDFFDHIAGPRFDTRLAYIVDELCEVFSVSDVHLLVQKHLRLFDVDNDKDPIIHFYEDFLKEYDPAERKKMGAYYTPIPVVKYIIRQVDSILRKDFGLSSGIADTSKIDHIVTDTGGKKYKNQIHRVQILDPAVGTATFLDQIIKYIHKTFKGQEGRWPAYAEADLVPRLYGFELMMAPYTIAHLKLGMTLQETGVKGLKQRLGVYLTNTLEEGQSKQVDLFSAFGLAETISQEAHEAAKIKHNKPIMVVMGNPPYSGVSSNETDYANSLIANYKVEPGGMQKLQERKHWLNDDYVKFIAFAEDLIAKNGEGIVAMITNNGFLDNPTFRGMRWHLATTFNKIYVLDLHGNAKKKEVAPDGGKDQNVFDIMQGVSIILAVKTKNTKQLADVYHSELFGTRQYKFNELNNKQNWQKLVLDKKMLYFVPKNLTNQVEYLKGIKINELLPQNVTGIVTMGDNFIIDESKQVIAERVQKLANGEYTEESLNTEFGLGKNYAKFVIDNYKNLVFDESKIVKISYRPFDNRYTYFDNKVLWRWRENVMRHFLSRDNIGLVVSRQCVGDWRYIFATDRIGEFNLTGTAGRLGSGNYLPLWLYHDDGTKTPNFDNALLKDLLSEMGPYCYTPERSDRKTPPEDLWVTAPDVLDYIYGVLHSPKYRQKYKEFLKTDFPRIPKPQSDSEFAHYSLLGAQLRELHLMQHSSLNTIDTTYPIFGTNQIIKSHFAEVRPLQSKKDVIVGKVYINDTQYFGNVPKVAWNFYIGGYQPAQKWLKDRKGRELTNDDIMHYQKIIKVLVETDKIMKQIDLEHK